MERLQELYLKILGLFGLCKGVVAEDNADNEFIDLVNQARYNWEAARSFFDNVTDSDLVDHAVYNLEAAEKKYLFLLKKARDTGCRINMEEDSILYN